MVTRVEVGRCRLTMVRKRADNNVLVSSLLFQQTPIHKVHKMLFLFPSSESAKVMQSRKVRKEQLLIHM